MPIDRLKAIQIELDEKGDPISSAYIQTVIDRLEEQARLAKISATAPKASQAIKGN